MKRNSRKREGVPGSLFLERKKNFREFQVSREKSFKKISLIPLSEGLIILAVLATIIFSPKKSELEQDQASDPCPRSCQASWELKGGASSLQWEKCLGSEPPQREIFSQKLNLSNNPKFSKAKIELSAGFIGPLSFLSPPVRISLLFRFVCVCVFFLFFVFFFVCNTSTSLN